jgi:hypothetical protein
MTVAWDISGSRQIPFDQKQVAMRESGVAVAWKLFAVSHFTVDRHHGYVS